MNPESFEEIGNMSLGDIEEPVLTPKGTYIVVLPQPEVATASTGTKGWAYNGIKPIEALPDVDRDQLAEVGGLQNISFDHTFYINQKSAFMFRNFLRDALGFSEGTSVNQAVAESAGKQVKATIIHEPSKRRDGTVGLRAVVGSWASV